MLIFRKALVLLLLVGVVTTAPRASVADSGRITVTGTSVTAIEDAIRRAGVGDTVYFPSGLYTIDRPFFFKDGVNLTGDPSSPAVLAGQGATSIVIHHSSGSPLRNVTIRGLQFDNIEIDLRGSSDFQSFRNVTFKDCLFRNGKRATPWSADSVYLVFRYTTNVTVDSCTFLRDSTSGGGGVKLDLARGALIKDSYFGTTRDLETGVPNGHFRTAINVSGVEGADRSENVVIANNVWRRKPGIVCPAGTEVALCQDHGLYAWGAKGLIIKDNFADGWDNDSFGGGMKLRNGDDYFVLNNRLLSSGIKTYTHIYDTLHTPHLLHARIEGNRVDVPNGGDGTEGIFYRRVDAAGSSKDGTCSGSGVEDDVRILNNTLVNAGEVDVQCVEPSEVCVEGNTRFDGHGLPIPLQGCTVPGSWDQPLAGVRSGDFNGDGQEDFVQWVAGRWRAHLSFGDGYVDQDWGDSAFVADDTENYGVHAADFSGDGRADLAYYGLCGNAPYRRCWRVHVSTGSGFTTLDYGDGSPYPSDETALYGFRSGDFNGDGRADIVSRGFCGNSTTRCWRMLASQANGTFSVARWDGDVWADPGVTGTYGLLVADFDGDGRDDVAYQGKCGSGVSCMRVHRSNGVSLLAPDNWGSIVADGHLTGHFGMHADDFNQDGKADIAYWGACSGPQWCRVEGR